MTLDDVNDLLTDEMPDQEYLDELAEADAAFAADTEDYITRFESGP